MCILGVCQAAGCGPGSEQQHLSQSMGPELMPAGTKEEFAWAIYYWPWTQQRGTVRQVWKVCLTSEMEGENMTYSKHSSRSAAEVETRLRDAAAKHRFGILNVLDVKETLKSKGIDFETPCRVYDVCNPQAANAALAAEMRISTVLPCRISVFGDDGGCTIATVKPTDLLRATGLGGVEDLAAEIEKEVVAMIEETA